MADIKVSITDWYVSEMITKLLCMICQMVLKVGIIILRI